MGGEILHIGQVLEGQRSSDEGELSAGDQVTMELDACHRLTCMRNHTAVHLLNSVLRSLLLVTTQRGSYVCSDYLKLDFIAFNQKIDEQFTKRVEELINGYIESGCIIERKEIQGEKLHYYDDIVLLPGENYPSDLRVVKIGDHWEPCCGTHLHRIQDIGHFVVVGAKSSGQNCILQMCH